MSTGGPQTAAALCCSAACTADQICLGVCGMSIVFLCDVGLAPWLWRRGGCCDCTAAAVGDPA